MISIIIPAYNVENYIESCLLSVIRQSGVEFEAIIVNDGSIDRTEEICKKWCERYSYITLYTQTNQGQGAARNKGISMAKGEWLVFLDADDQLCEGALKELERYTHTDNDIVYYGYYLYTKNLESHEVEIPDEITDKKTLLAYSSTFLWDKMFRKEFWNENKIILGNTYGEDLCGVCQLEVYCKIYQLIRKPLVIHFERQDNLSSKPEKVAEIVKSIEDTILIFKENNWFEEYSEELFNMVYHQYELYSYVLLERMPEHIAKYIQKELRRISLEYFEIQTKIRESELVIIGECPQCTLMGKDLFPRIQQYNDIEEFTIRRRKGDITNQVYFINFSSECRNLRFGTRTKEWEIIRWQNKLIEFLKIAQNLGEILYVIIYDRRYEEHDFLKQSIKDINNFIVVTEKEKINLIPHGIKIYLSRAALSENHYDNFWCKGEQYRLQYNENILNGWLKLLHQNINLH